MKIPNPLQVLGWVLWAVWYPFGFVFTKLMKAACNSDRCWNWLVSKMQEGGIAPETINDMNQQRLRLLAGGADVVLPESGGVENSQAEQAEKQSEAK